MAMKSTEHFASEGHGQVKYPPQIFTNKLKGIARTVYGDHERYLDTYIKVSVEAKRQKMYWKSPFRALTSAVMELIVTLMESTQLLVEWTMSSIFRDTDWVLLKLKTAWLVLCRFVICYYITVLDHA